MKPYDLTRAFEVYRNAVDRKINAGEKVELLSIRKAMRSCYVKYNKHFFQNNLEYMPRARVGVRHKDALLGLYGSQTKLVTDFRERFFKINAQTFYNLCPYCAINSSGTTDHILPRELYPEYAVNVLNLIPCCGDCNSLKGDDVLDKNRQRFILNYYTDRLPDKQFLFVNIDFNGVELTFRYYISNASKVVDPNLFALIERHFVKLHLLCRYDEKAIQEIAEIKNAYLAERFEDVNEYDSFAKKQLIKSDLDAQAYGRNHWKIVLVDACARSSIFKQYILSQ